jgi:hypothetical protein
MYHGLVARVFSKHGLQARDTYIPHEKNSNLSP